jgi:hypothetical protein
MKDVFERKGKGFSRRASTLFFVERSGFKLPFYYTLMYSFAVTVLLISIHLTVN